jgi:hypothetical protein
MLREGAIQNNPVLFQKVRLQNPENDPVGRGIRVVPSIPVYNSRFICESRK